MRTPFATIAIILSAAGIAAAQDPVFSIARNLVVGTQVERKQLTFRADLAPLDAQAADTCCAVRPGQPVTLVRGDHVVGAGALATIVASAVPRAGDDRLVYFTVRGMPDSLAVETGPPTVASRDTGTDIYVATTASVMVLPRPSQRWADPDSVRAMIPPLFAEGTIHDGDFPEDAFESPRLDPWLDADRASTWWMAHREMVNGAVAAPGYETVSILATRQLRGFCLDFVRLDAPAWPRPVDLEGRLERLLAIDGVVYVVVIDCQSGTGMWGYVIHGVWPGGSTRRVHADGSWQT